MATELRKTGISVVGDLPWGTHFCHFYETKQDLLDTLVPYFKVGLESKEFCLWVVSDSELITVEEAKGALARAVPDLDRHLADGNIEILNGLEWYLEKNAFNLEKVTNAWDAKLKRALALRYDGMRVSGDTFWLKERDWKDFVVYEKQINDWVTDQRMTVLCTYSLTNSGAAEVLDVVQTHKFATARRQGQWEVIETPEVIQAKAEIKRLHDELEQKVIERTNELSVANEDLRKEIAERKQVEALLHAKEQEFRAIVENAPDQIIRYDREFRRTYVNPAVAQFYGLPAETLIGKPLGSDIPQAGLEVKDDEIAQVRQRIADVFNTGKTYDYELTWTTPAGRRYFSVRLFPELDLDDSVVNVLGISRDITESKQAEKKLRTTSEQLRALSARFQSAREEEGMRIAREIHDELGSALTSLKWDLEGMAKMLSVPKSGSELASMKGKAESMKRLVDGTIDVVRRISAELRPGVLDDLGLMPAIEWQARQFHDRTGIGVHCDCSVDDVGLNQEQSTTVFRILQEALTNILRHAQATRVDIRAAEEAGEFILTISDNGKGISEAETSGLTSLGLLGMRERAILIGGKIEIAGIEGKGTVITLRVPLGRAGRAFGAGK